MRVDLTILPLIRLKSHLVRAKRSKVSWKLCRRYKRSVLSPPSWLSLGCRSLIPVSTHQLLWKYLSINLRSYQIIMSAITVESYQNVSVWSFNILTAFQPFFGVLDGNVFYAGLINWLAASEQSFHFRITNQNGRTCLSSSYTQLMSCPLYYIMYSVAHWDSSMR